MAGTSLTCCVRSGASRHTSLLLGDPRVAGHWLAVRADDERGVGDGEDVRMAGAPKASSTLAAPGPTALRPRQFGAGRGFNAGAPEIGASPVPSPANHTPPLLDPVTPAPRRTSTPSCSNERRAVSDSDGSKDVS